MAKDVIIACDFNSKEEVLNFLSKFENKDSIAPNLEINRLWRSSKFCFNSDKNIFIEKASSWGFDTNKLIYPKQ